VALPSGLLMASRVLRRQGSGADFQHSGQLDQLGLVLVGVVLAEEKLRTRWQLGAHTGGSTAPIAPISLS
jgi:hypothetical protein